MVVYQQLVLGEMRSEGGPLEQEPRDGYPCATKRRDPSGPRLFLHRFVADTLEAYPDAELEGPGRATRERTGSRSHTQRRQRTDSTVDAPRSA